MKSNLLPFWHSCLSAIRLPSVVAAGLIGLLQPVCAQVTIEIVNDTGLPDTNIFIKVPGQHWPGVTNQPVTPADLFVDTALSSPPNPVSIVLSTLPTNSSLSVSSISGNTNTVYSFQADYLDSGTIYFT